MKSKGGTMPDWVIYGLFPLYIMLTVALIIYGIALSLKKPRYDVVAEAEAYLVEVQMKREVRE